jgi:hypothetical protein
MKKLPALLTNPTESKLEFDMPTVELCLQILRRRFMGDLNREDMEVRRCIQDIENYFGVKNDTN